MKISFRTLLVLCVLYTAIGASAQDKIRTLVINKPELKATLVDEFGILNSEERSARFDSFFQELRNRPSSVGYVFLFCGRECGIDEIEAHIRGIEVKIALRDFDRSRIVVLNGGFWKDFTTQLYVVPAGACPPIPQSHLLIQNVKFVKSARQRELYDCCDDYSDVWEKLTKKKP